MNHLPAKCIYKWIILPFRISDDDIVLCSKESVGNLPLCRERFSRAGRSQNQTVRVLQLFPIHHDHVVGECIQPVIQRLPRHEKLLRGERYKNGS